MSSAKSDHFISFLPICTPVTFSCLITVAGTSNTVIDRSGKSGIPILFLILEERFQLFNIEFDISCGFIINGIFMLRYVAYTHTDECFYHKWMWNCVICFFCICRENDVIFSLLLLMLCITVIDFCTLNEPCIPEISSTWSWLWSFWYLVEFG